MMKIFCVVLALLAATTFAGITLDKDTKHGHSSQFFESVKQNKQKEGKLYIHVIPHTHDDVGWLKTPDQYYSGDDDYYQRAGVQYVLNGIYDELMKDPNKKFTYVEMAFFQKWWYEQTYRTKLNVQKLVDEGRLQFVNAGWSMSDEACVHYEDFINNMKVGHDFLNKQLGYRPTIGWHIDPFGHHSATAAMFAEMGFNAWFFARMDRDDKARRIEDKEMEFLWRPFNESLGPRAEILTHMMYHHYSAPPGFCFSEFCTDSPIVDNKLLRTYNADKKTDELYDYLIHMAEHYRTNHLFVPFGDDFNYLNAQKMFLNIDKLIYYMNRKYDDIEMFYSTPYDYVDALNKLEAEWPTKYDDLFPYSDGPDAYWTGYFTSRANFKSYVRQASSDFNSHSYYLALDNIVNNADIFEPYQGLFEQMGVAQHHDAVTGTEKQHVERDYADTLTIALDAEKKQFLESFKRISYTSLVDLSMCQAHNSTYHDCPTKILEDKNVSQIKFHVVNPSNRRTTVARIPVPHANLTLHKMDGSPQDFDIICYNIVHNITTNSTIGCAMYFEMDMSGFSDEKLVIMQSDTSQEIKPSSNTGSIATSSYTASLNSLSSEAKLSFTHNTLNTSQAVLMKYLYYDSFQLNTDQRSGAYIFRPNKTDQVPKEFNGFTSYDGYNGQFVKQLVLYGEQIDTIISGSVHTDFVEIDTYLKGIPLTDQGQEVILHFTFDEIKNNGTFYTDSMGLEMQKRIVDYRPTWKLNKTQPISENYYPVNHGVTIKDDLMTLEILNDRSQGATSLRDGEIEFMIQRRMYKDDGRGVGEALNETNPDSLDGRGIQTNFKHFLRFYNNTEQHDVVQNSRWMQREIDMPLIYVFGVEGNSTDTKENEYNKKLFMQNFVLPDEVKMVMHPQANNSIFVRFENILDCVMDSIYQKSNNNISCDSFATINVDEIARTLANLTSKMVKSVTEVSNTGLYTMEEMKEIRMKWKGTDYTTPEPDYSSNTTNIELTPQRIRSFILDFDDTKSTVGTIRDYLSLLITA